MYSDALVVAMALGVAACATLVGVGLAAWVSGRGRAAPAEPPSANATIAELPPTAAAGVDRKQLRAFAQELSAHAYTAAEQAARARIALGAALEALSVAESERARAEAEYDAARTAYANALPTTQVSPPDPLTEARERDVSRAALDAYRRGELSVEVLRTVFGHPTDPGRELRDRETDRLALAESHARRAFQQAVAAARVAREEVHIAEVADAAVRQEAADAALEAHEVQLAVQATFPRKRRGTTNPPARRRSDR